MRFEKALRLSSYVLVLAGFSALATSGAVTPAVTALYLGAVLVSWVKEIRLNRWHQWVAVLVLWLIFLAETMIFSGMVSASIHLLLSISLIKLFGEKKGRDLFLLYAISFAFLLIASAYSISILFLVALILYVFAAILTFVLFESRLAYFENPSASFSLAGYIQAALAISALIVLVAVPIFVSVPRATFGFFRWDNPNGLQLTGFSDRVSLGDLGPVIASRDVFMRVRVESRQGVPDDLRWRGIVLDNYDGRAWTNSPSQYRYIARDPQTGVFPVAAESSPGDWNLRQRITAEPYVNAAFAAGRVLQVSASTREQLRQDGNGSLSFTRGGRRDSLRYVVDSSYTPRRELIGKIRSRPIPSEISETYLQVPEIDPRIQQLAKELTARARTPLEKAVRLENFLRSNYGYSLDNLAAASPDPLANFLLNVREGHCEYFATSLAVMLRMVGVPSRIVNGFQRGELNEWGSYYIVRRSDAHSWVEAYFPGAGWIEFDATPSRQLGTALSAFRWARQMLDALDLFWNEVVTFDRLKQFGFFRSVGTSLRGGIERLGDSLSGLGRLEGDWKEGIRGLAAAYWPAGVALAVILGAGSLLWRFRRALSRFVRRKLLRQGSSELAPLFYLELLELLSRKGFKREASETPLEFAQRVTGDTAMRAPVFVTQLYYRARFGTAPLTDWEMGEIESALRQVRSARFRSRPA